MERHAWAAYDPLLEMMRRDCDQGHLVAGHEYWAGRADIRRADYHPFRVLRPRVAKHLCGLLRGHVGQARAHPRQGNGVALNHSLGSSSGVITPGLGFMYNDSMVNFHPLVGQVNAIAPGKSRTTGMITTVVHQEGRPVLVIGAPSATRIITSVAQVILNVLDFGMSISDAVLSPRFDCQGEPIRCQTRIPEMVCAEVRKAHPVEHMPHAHDGLGLVHAIHIDPASGRLSGAADTGAGGMALGCGGVGSGDESGLGWWPAPPRRNGDIASRGLCWVPHREPKLLAQSALADHVPHALGIPA